MSSMRSQVKMLGRLWSDCVLKEDIAASYCVGSRRRSKGSSWSYMSFMWSQVKMLGHLKRSLGQLWAGCVLEEYRLPEVIMWKQGSYQK